MPRFDGTGPAGMGAMTGRGMGYCTGGNVAYGRRCYGGRRGFSRRAGLSGMPGRRGPGYGYGFMGAYPDNFQQYPVDEKSVMEDQIKFLEEELKLAKEHLAGLNKED